MRILRTYARVYVSDLDAVLPTLSQLSDGPVRSRFAMPNGLELAAVDRLLVVAGDDAALAPYRATVATLIVDDLDAYAEALRAVGADIIRGPQDVPTGRNLTAVLPDGPQLEYVEWTAEQWHGDASA